MPAVLFDTPGGGSVAVDPGEVARVAAAGPGTGATLVRLLDGREFPVAGAVGEVLRRMAEEATSGRRPAPVRSPPVPTPEELAERYVALEPDHPGAWHAVRLTAPGAEAVILGPFANPARARETAEAVRRFVAAAIVAAAPPDPDSPM